MAEPDATERERKIAWLKQCVIRRNAIEPWRKIVAARIGEWEHEIAVRVAVYIGVIAFVVAVAALSGVPVFSARMAWVVIVITVLSTLYELWG